MLFSILRHRRLWIKLGRKLWKARYGSFLVHGDDSTTAGSKPDLDWFELELEAKYELRKSGRIGPGEDDDKEGHALNRVVRWTEDGLEYEAEFRQAEKLIESIGPGAEGVRSTVTPGLEPMRAQIAGENELGQHEHTPY